MKKINNMIKRIVRDRHIVFFIGIMFIIMGLISLSDNIFEKMLGIKFHIAHGMLFLGIFNVVMALVFILVGTQSVEMGISSNDETNPLEEINNKIKMLEDRIKELENGK